jgi:hypothetical protein
MRKVQAWTPLWRVFLPTVARIVLSLSLCSMVPGCTALQQQQLHHSPSALVSQIMRLIASQTLADKLSVEQTLGLEIMTRADFSNDSWGFWGVRGWLAPPGSLADGAYLRKADRPPSQNRHCCRDEIAALWLGFQAAPCITMDLVRDLFYRDGWTFKTKTQTTVATFATEQGMVDRYGKPLLVGVGELAQTGSLTFEFPSGPTNCASHARAVQYF